MALQVISDTSLWQHANKATCVNDGYTWLGVCNHDWQAAMPEALGTDAFARHAAAVASCLPTGAVPKSQQCADVCRSWCTACLRAQMLKPAGACRRHP